MCDKGKCAVQRREGAYNGTAQKNWNMKLHACSTEKVIAHSITSVIEKIDYIRVG